MSKTEQAAGARLPRALPTWRFDLIQRWLTDQAPQCRDVAEMLAELAQQLLAAGLPLWRFTLHVGTLHPQFRGYSYEWRAEWGELRVVARPHGVQSSAGYQQSPIAVIHAGATEIRRRLDHPAEPDFPILVELREAGAVEYVAMPLRAAIFAQGRPHCLTISSDRPGGFTDGELAQFRSLVPTLGVVVDLMVFQQTARTVLATYLGAGTGDRVLDGQIQRGDCDPVPAAIWMCDLRNFTATADMLPAGDVIALLNDYFERVAEPVHRHGGEVLKFIGDGMLAVFRVAARRGPPDACNAAYDAAVDALAAIDAGNVERVADGKPPHGIGLALHLGEVQYGNIGAATRLDFTVIGPAVNLTSRIEGLCKPLGRRLLLSADFATACDRPLRSLGAHAVRGLANPIEIFEPRQ
jgi:adenylate cyclase